MAPWTDERAGRHSMYTPTRKPMRAEGESVRNCSVAASNPIICLAESPFRHRLDVYVAANLDREQYAHASLRWDGHHSSAGEGVIDALDRACVAG
jgi:hypothetical protein